MRAEFWLCKYQNRRGHYARVIVDAELIAGGVFISEAIDEALNIDYGAITRKIDPDWMDAAIAGVEYCGETLVSQGQLPGCRVEVRSVCGVLTDTTEEDLFCAGALATWQALRPDMELPQFHFADNRWHIKF